MTTDSAFRWQPLLRAIGIAALLGPLLAACAVNHHYGRKPFTSKEYGVAVSPRVTTNPNPPHGGGRYLVGQPYEVHGEWYKPKADPVGYTVVGEASWYGWDFHGRLTANGEIFSANAITGGSPDLPLPCYARVTNLENGRSLLVRFNDRGPYMQGRVIDLSERAASLLGYANTGTAKVKVQYVGPAPLNGDDTRYLMASLNQSTPYTSSGGTQLAMADLPQRRDAVIPEVRPVAYTSRPRSRGTDNTEINAVMASVNGLFSFADEKKEEVDVNSAHAAVDAMAARVPDLQDWVDRTDVQARSVHLGLGVYANPAVARDTAMKFAMLGAVDEDTVTLDDGSAGTRLTMSYLKPGVGREDVLDLAHKLGVKDTTLY